MAEPLSSRVPDQVLKNWWWLNNPLELHAPNRRSALFYEFASRLYRKANNLVYPGQRHPIPSKNKNLKFDRPWPELSSLEKLILMQIWPPLFDDRPAIWEFGGDTEIRALLESGTPLTFLKKQKEEKIPGWSPWLLMSLNLSHDDATLVQAFVDAVRSIRHQTDQDKLQMNKWKPTQPLAFTCIEAHDAKQAKVVISGSEESTLRQKIKAYKAEIDEGLKLLIDSQFLDNAVLNVKESKLNDPFLHIDDYLPKHVNSPQLESPPLEK